MNDSDTLNKNGFTAQVEVEAGSRPSTLYSGLKKFKKPLRIVLGITIGIVCLGVALVLGKSVLSSQSLSPSKCGATDGKKCSSSASSGRTSASSKHSRSSRVLEPASATSRGIALPLHARAWSMIRQRPKLVAAAASVIIIIIAGAVVASVLLLRLSSHGDVAANTGTPGQSITTPSSTPGHLDIGAIAGEVIGGVVGVIVLIAVVVLVRRLQHRSTQMGGHTPINTINQTIPADGRPAAVLITGNGILTEQERLATERAGTSNSERPTEDEESEARRKISDRPVSAVNDDNEKRGGDEEPNILTANSAPIPTQPFKSGQGVVLEPTYHNFGERVIGDKVTGKVDFNWRTMVHASNPFSDEDTERIFDGADNQLACKIPDLKRPTKELWKCRYQMIRLVACMMNQIRDGDIRTKSQISIKIPDKRNHMIERKFNSISTLYHDYGFSYDLLVGYSDGKVPSKLVAGEAYMFIPMDSLNREEPEFLKFWQDTYLSIFNMVNKC